MKIELTHLEVLNQYIEKVNAIIDKPYEGDIHAKENELNNIEKQKESYKNTYFLKDNKDNCVTNINNKYAT